MISGLHFGIVSPYTLNLKPFYVFLFSIFGSPAPFFMWLQHVERAICWVSSTSLSPPAWAKVTLLRRKVGRRKYRGIPPPIFIFRMFSFSVTVVLILYFVCSEQMIHKTLEWSIVAVHLKTKQTKHFYLSCHELHHVCSWREGDSPALLLTSLQPAT